MNIFVTDPDPVVSAQCLPDKHVVKMPLETCQMLSIVASEKWGHGFGTLPKKDCSSLLTDPSNTFPKQEEQAPARHEEGKSKPASSAASKIY